jgi:hypothetical protein
MPIRIASVNHKLEKNGARLHLAMLARIHSQGADHEPSEAELALLEERRALKEERAKRHDDASHPKPKASKLVRTHHPEAKADHKPKVKKEKDAKPVAKGAHKQTRAEKHASKAAALEAAKKAAKKSATKT